MILADVLPPKLKFKHVVVAGAAVPNVKEPDAGVVDSNGAVATEKPVVCL